jgi:hypothetical protein
MVKFLLHPTYDSPQRRLQPKSFKFSFGYCTSASQASRAIFKLFELNHQRSRSLRLELFLVMKCVLKQGMLSLVIYPTGLTLTLCSTV